MLKRTPVRVTLTAFGLFLGSALVPGAANAAPPKYPCGFYLKETARDADGKQKEVWTPVPEKTSDDGTPSGHKKKITIGGRDKEGAKPLTNGIICGGECENDAAGCEQACVHTAIFDTSGAGAETHHFCDCEKVAPPTPPAQSSQPTTVSTSVSQSQGE